MTVLADLWIGRCQRNDHYNIRFSILFRNVYKSIQFYRFLYIKYCWSKQSEFSLTKTYTVKLLYVFINSSMSIEIYMVSVKLRKSIALRKRWVRFCELCQYKVILCWKVWHVILFVLKSMTRHTVLFRLDGLSKFCIFLYKEINFFI